MDGIDRLLQIVAYYRRRQPQSPEVKAAFSMNRVNAFCYHYCHGERAGRAENFTPPPRLPGHGGATVVGNGAIS